ncbi:MAG: penicillin-binding protein 2 [Patescibacteria group bacterium]|jgi:penicillin-binding protein 2|nr:penicillin-binding protein 2 [Patescibacteria group bacterium]|tara:strand:- start:27688 stop:29607 length:1920 start_codon:yes stop_codon:yes gene_type:complete
MEKDPFLIKQEATDISDPSIDSFSSEIDGDIVIADSYRKQVNIGWKNKKSLQLLAVLGMLLFGSLFAKLYYLQVVRGAEYYGTAEGNRIRSLSIIPPRGVIIDSNGKKLAYNVPDFALVVIPADLPHDQEAEDAIFSSIAELIGISHFDLIESFSNIERTSENAIEIARGITQEQAVVIASSIQEWQGISLVPVEKRTYQITDPLSHILGYTGKISTDDYEILDKDDYELFEHVGKIGLEKVYQDQLRGVLGELRIEVDSNGIFSRKLTQTEPVMGNNMYLHLNSELQMFIWQELEKMIIERESPGGSVIVMDPETGAIKALVSYPGFDNGKFSRGIDSKAYQSLLKDERKPLFNRSIAGEYPSGSTIKLVVGSAALEEGIITPYTTISSTGGISVNQYWYPDWKYGGHGRTDIEHALAESVNTFFYAIGGGYESIEGLGVSRISDYGVKFGLNTKTGIDLPSESMGFLPSKDWKLQKKGERWYLGDTYHLAIGQGDISVTPIQVANFTSVIANGGTLYSPRIVDKIGRNYDDAEIIKPIVLSKQVVDPNTIRTIQQGLRSVVTYGTARSLSVLPVDIAGKTGTAQFSSTKEPHAWFTGYAPYNNPEIVVTVLVEEGEGGDISATPIAKKIFEWYFSKI